MKTSKKIALLAFTTITLSSFANMASAAEKFGAAKEKQPTIQKDKRAKKTNQPTDSTIDLGKLFQSFISSGSGDPCDVHWPYISCLN